MESGILANLTELLHNNRSVTIKFLISLCENPICAQRVAFSLSFSDFISEKPTTKPNINNDIELLLLLLEPNFEIFKRIFIDALCFIISENPEHISYIIFRIIEKIEESKFVKQILHLLQDQDIRKIIQSSSLPNDLNKTAIAMKIIDFLIDQNNEAKDGIFLDIISVYDDLLFDEKALIIHFIASFDFTTNDEFFSFFLKHDELIEFSDIKIIFDQILENLIKNDLQQIEALIEEDKWEQMYQRLLQINHTISPSLPSSLLELLIAPTDEVETVYKQIIIHIVSSLPERDMEIDELFDNLKVETDLEDMEILNGFMKKLEDIYNDAEININRVKTGKC